MKATTIAAGSNRFKVEWGDDGDASPPPGYDLAAKMLKSLVSAGVSSGTAALPKDHWEHSYWYFFVDWDDSHYRIDIEPSIGEEEPPIWIITLSKCHGIFKSLFGSNELPALVDDEFRRIVENCVREVTDSENLTWITSIEASRRYLGTAP